MVSSSIEESRSFYLIKTITSWREKVFFQDILTPTCGVFKTLYQAVLRVHFIFQIVQK